MAKNSINPATQGLSFAAKVAERADMWGDFGKLRSDFLKLDSKSARKLALNTLRDSKNADLRQFAKALEDATSKASVPHKRARSESPSVRRTPLPSISDAG